MSLESCYLTICPHLWRQMPMNIRACTLFCKQPVQSHPDAVVFPDFFKEKRDCRKVYSNVKTSHENMLSSLDSCQSPCLPCSVSLGSCQPLRRQFIHPPAAAAGLSPSPWSAVCSASSPGHPPGRQAAHTCSLPPVNLLFLKWAPQIFGVYIFKFFPLLDGYSCKSACLSCSH